MTSPILDLAGVTLDVNHLPRAARYYAQLFGLTLETLDDERGVATLRVNDHQTLTLWRPTTRTHPDDTLAPLRARGASHLHYAWQVHQDDLDACKATLDAHGVPWQAINLGTDDHPDVGLYFLDPCGHGLELRGVNPDDERRPFLPVRPVPRPTWALPILGLREVALAFEDYAAMKTRLPRAYGFAFAKEQDGRDFAQFTLGPSAEEDGNGTPRRWLYAWDPQIGLADMPGGDHATVSFYADVPDVTRRVQAEGLPHVTLPGGALAARDPDGHVFVFHPAPARP
ncbi:VOC family protein [Deinococcus maricopensis]|uniref:Glyoxalase/bleomycin resistance protein/dioxygenase n=1 Tax=Deinococcus maricopensis (strain DSM 21211 / LMG 22137 / NRRL B-23946 / LB-34) TaxID=709986 RepID=E8U977_DEIML|nr:VOC family protein [Deinococcus maricopensis]ADV67616.1 Glyoxalase/bleomycin resistance protein/dioxygenase [Deinococcus maricopensis DSM 21211]